MSDPTPAQEPGLSFRLDVTWLYGILRADAIRRDTLVSLVQTWAEDGAREDVIDQLDALAEAVQSPREGELDGLLEAVESAAAMDDAEVRIDLHAALRLRAELDAVIAKLARFNPTRVELPRQQDRRAA
ncbi:hypothetical protein [Streptomyces sp. NPDC002467]|uniref:hypothetical protein n=1 Tax=Streptomyces sp. NPDC002467 TaxID=3364647 RepID=UPI0036803B53